MIPTHRTSSIVRYLGLTLSVLILGCILLAGNTLHPATATGEATPAATNDPFDAIRALYDYKPVGLNVVKELKTEQRGSVTIHSIMYPTLIQGSDVFVDILAYLVVPEGKGPYSGVLFAHWVGTTNSNRDEFLDEAVDMASKGTVSLLVNDVFQYSRFYNGDVDHDTKAVIRGVVDLRQALDILIAQPQVDPKRLAVVGHDFGGIYVSILAGIDPRPKGYVVMASVPRFTDWPPFKVNSDNAPYLAQMDNFAPTLYLPHKQGDILFQFSTKDSWVTSQHMNAMFDAATEPKKLLTYDTIGHDLRLQKVYDDRQQWLHDLLAN